ncbi:MAG: LysR family transcriptional regulator [Acidimicrobiales bacterium]
MPLSASFPNLVSLGVFVSVVELGSVSKAAAAHHMAQPSASNRLRILERQLGLTLLDRSSSGSIPTAEGSVVAGWAAGVLRAAEQLSAGVAALQAEASGLLRIGASFTVAEYLLPPWLERFVRDRPTDSVSLLVANSASVEGQLNNGLVDLGFIESPHPTPALSSQVVGRDELVVVVAPGHPWSGRPSISLDALASTPLVLRERGSGTRDALIEAFDRLGYPEPVSVLELGSTAAVRAAVMNGSSPTIVSRLTVAADLTTQSLVEIDVPGLSIQRDLRAVWRHGVELSPLAAALLAQLPNL